jgi:hypothetical protein
MQRFKYKPVRRVQMVFLDAAAVCGVMVGAEEFDAWFEVEGTSYRR